MADTDYEHERAKLERKFQKFARENPDHPAVISAIACRIARRKTDEPSQCEREWLDLALKEPNNPRVLRVRKVVADVAANREGQRKNRPVFVEPFRLPVRIETLPWDSQQRQKKVENAPPNLKLAQESERLHAVLTEEQADALFDDLDDHLQITRALKRFSKMHSGNSTVN